jgi:hypothetical protein
VSGRDHRAGTRRRCVCCLTRAPCAHRRAGRPCRWPHAIGHVVIAAPWHAMHAHAHAQPRGPTPPCHALAALPPHAHPMVPCCCRLAMLGSACTSPCRAWECRVLLPSTQLINATLLPPLAGAVHCGVVPCHRRLVGCDSAAKRLVHVLLFTIARARLCFEMMATSATTAPGQACLTSLFLCRRAVPRQARSVDQIHEIACARGWSRDLATRRTLPLLLPIVAEPQFDGSVTVGHFKTPR